MADVLGISLRCEFLCAPQAGGWISRPSAATPTGGIPKSTGGPEVFIVIRGGSVKAAIDTCKQTIFVVNINTGRRLLLCFVLGLDGMSRCFLLAILLSAFHQL